MQIRNEKRQTHFCVQNVCHKIDTIKVALCFELEKSIGVLLTYKKGPLSITIISPPNFSASPRNTDNGVRTYILKLTGDNLSLTQKMVVIE
jgi:hypothetical protein